MAWVDIYNGEDALGIRNKLNTLGASNDLKSDKRTSQVLRTTDYTLGLTDEATLQKCLSSSSITITIPANSSVEFPLNTEIIFVRYGTGAVTFTPSSGVTINSAESRRNITKQYESPPKLNVI